MQIVFGREIIDSGPESDYLPQYDIVKITALELMLIISQICPIRRSLLKDFLSGFNKEVRNTLIRAYPFGIILAGIYLEDLYFLC